MLKNYHEKKEATREFFLPFDFKGNTNNVTVERIQGDNDVHSASGHGTLGRLWANLRIVPEKKVVRLFVRYRVEECSGDKTILTFDATQDYPLEAFVGEGLLNAQKAYENNSSVVDMKCNSKIELVGSYNESYIITQFSGECHDYMTPQAWDRTKATQVNSIILKLLPASQHEAIIRQYVSIPQTWLPVRDIKMKVDDKGDDVKGSGNIGVCGNVRFTIKRIDDIDVTVRLKDESPSPSNISTEPTKGSMTKLDSIPEKVSSVLGCGYDICGYYASVDSVKEVILDLDKLNENNRIGKRPVSQSFHISNTGESIKDYTENMLTKLNLQLSVNAYGGFLKAETDRSFSVNKEEHSSYKYASYRSGYKDSEYTVSFYSPRQLWGCLRQDFLDALNNLSASDFIEKFGTHVVLGMALGTRFSYSMRYKESTRKHSEASSFVDSISIGYKDTGEIDVPEKPKSKSEAEKIFDAINADGKISPEELNAYAAYLKAAGESKSQQAPSGGGGGGKIDVEAKASYSVSEAWSLNEEDKSTVIKCDCIGGDAYLCGLINEFNDSQYFIKWIESNRTNCVFCDFVRGSLIPIYELVPDGYRLSAQDIKRASEEYQIWERMTKKMISGITYYDFDTMASANTKSIQKLTSKDHDDEIGTKTGKDVYWELHVDLVNFDGGKCGFSISLIVKEGGSGGSASILLNHFSQAIPLERGLQQMAIDTSYFGGGKPEFDAHATWSGQLHGWQGATSDVLMGTAGDVLCCNGNTVKISVDGKGSDLGNIGVKGTIMIPYIGY